ncbi:major facilitator superfamily transporter protein [Rutstroemia sp. NJR-2017a WRK4]|nr:major facilitator superfamily transporter protein [Rutstroemia sp. NJR-2017a WRK4]
MTGNRSARDYSATQGSVYLITSDGRTLQLPVPSESPNDPLNWSSYRLFLALFSMSLFSIIGLVQVQGTSLLLGALENEYTPEVRGQLLRLVSSVGALIWVPVSLAIGRRPVFLFCTVLLTLATLMAAFSQSFNTHLAARCFQGLAGAVSPSTMILMVIDVTYIHQRPLYIALFWCFCNSISNFFLAATPAMVNAGGSWRAFYWPFPIILALFWCPETVFDRPPVAFDGHILSQAETGKVTVYNDWEEVPGGRPEIEHPASSNSTSSFVKDIIFWNRSSIGGWSAMREFPRQILICTLNPLILWVLILNAFIFGGMIITCASYAELLSAPPYNFSFQAIGLAKFATGIGAILAFPASGLLTSQVIRILAARNNGVREPEHYLPSFILPVIVSTTSLALYGIASERHWDWRWILLFVGADYFSAICIFTSNTLWVTEAFPRWKGAALVIVGAGGYGLSFALSFGMVPWIESQGLGGRIVLTLVVGLVGVPVNWWGKRFREYIYSVWERVE